MIFLTFPLVCLNFFVYSNVCVKLILIFILGYAPLLVRLVQALGVVPSWAEMSDAFKLLPGPVVEMRSSMKSDLLSDSTTKY